MPAAALGPKPLAAARHYFKFAIFPKTKSTKKGENRGNPCVAPFPPQLFLIPPFPRQMGEQGSVRETKLERMEEQDKNQYGGFVQRTAALGLKPLAAARPNSIQNLENGNSKVDIFCLK